MIRETLNEYEGHLHETQLIRTEMWFRHVFRFCRIVGCDFVSESWRSGNERPNISQ